MNRGGSIVSRDHLFENLLYLIGENSATCTSDVLFGGVVIVYHINCCHHTRPWTHLQLTRIL